MTGDTLGSVRQLAGTGSPPMLEVCYPAVADLTLRDWFAGQAIVGIMAAGLAGTITDLVASAWTFADAMLVEREKEKKT